jgi:peptidoglycan/LPS O-acetylase OafA/YrhL
MIISHELRKHSPNPIFECSELFAIGGLLNLFSDTLESLSNKWVSIAVPVFALALFSALVIGGRMASVEALTFFGFPSIILVAVVSERRWYSLGKTGDFFGNITYSSYLIHVPIQIAAMLVMDAVFKSRDMVATRPFFLGYLIFVVAAAYFVYKKIELPLKKRMLAMIER